LFQGRAFLRAAGFSLWPNRQQGTGRQRANVAQAAYVGRRVAWRSQHWRGRPTKARAGSDEPRRAGYEPSDTPRQ